MPCFIPQGEACCDTVLKNDALNHASPCGSKHIARDVEAIPRYSRALKNMTSRERIWGYTANVEESGSGCWGSRWRKLEVGP